MNLKTFSLSLFIASATAVTSAQVMPAGQFHSHVSTDGKAQRWPERNSWLATISDDAGRVLYTISKEVYYDIPMPVVYVVPSNGSSVVTNSFEGIVEFYDETGRLERAIRLFDDSTPKHERILTTSLAERQAAFLISEPDGGKARVILTDLKGNQLWTLQLPGKHAAEIFISRDGKYITAGSYSVEENLAQTTLVDETGGVIRTLDGIFRKADQFHNTLALSGRNQVLLTSLSPVGPIVEWSTSRKTDIITELRLVGEMVLVVVESVGMETGKPIYRDPTFIVLNGAGIEMERRTISGRSDVLSTLTIEENLATLSSKAGHVTIELGSRKR